MTSRGRPRRGRPRAIGPAGFTLLELGITLALLALMAAVAIPQLGQITEANIKNQSRLLVGAIEYASGQAVSRRRIYRLYFDLDEGRYWLAAQNRGGQYRPLKQDLLGRARPLNEGVSFEDVLVVDTLYKRGLTYAEFLPDGTCDPLLIHFKTEQDDHYSVLVDQYIAGGEIDNVYVEPKDYTKIPIREAR